MSKPLVIFGTTELAELAHYYFTHDGGRRVAAFSLDEAYITSDIFCGLPVVPFATVQELFPPEEYELFVAAGYTKVNTLRRDKYFEAKAKGYTLPSFIHSSSTVSAKQMGDNCFIQEHNVVQPFVTIGNNVLFWVGNAIGHYAVIEDHCAITSHVVVCGGVTVKEGAFIGVNATIRDYISIGRYCVIGAGAIILKDTGDEEVYASQNTPLFPKKSTELSSI